MVWMMNMYNFMDGSNGMAAFQGVFAGLVLAVLFQNGGQSEMSVLAPVFGFGRAVFPAHLPEFEIDNFIDEDFLFDDERQYER